MSARVDLVAKRGELREVIRDGAIDEFVEHGQRGASTQGIADCAFDRADATGPAVDNDGLAGMAAWVSPGVIRGWGGRKRCAYKAR